MRFCPNRIKFGQKNLQKKFVVLFLIFDFIFFWYPNFVVVMMDID